MPFKFELTRLLDYSDQALLDELRRVASLTEGAITAAVLLAHGRASPSVYRRRFGGLENALRAAGLADRYSGRTVSRKMRAQRSRTLGDDALLQELRRVAVIVPALTQPGFNSHSHLSASVYPRRFGSWNKALRLAGLSPVPRGRRHTETDYLENLMAVWVHHGRQPNYREMDHPPSRITAGAYERRWGSWRGALAAFMDYVKSPRPQVTPESPRPHADTSVERDPVRKVPLSMRFQILSRDRFCCVLCGESPAKGSRYALHLDHIVPWKKGGRTVPENLRTLCERCNIGRGADEAPRLAT